MRILVYCPLAPYQPRLFAKALTAMFEQTWDGLYELMYGVSASALDVTADMQTKMDRARKQAVDGGYDALFVVGYDIQLPPDAMERLAAVDADVVYGIAPGIEWPYTWQEADHLHCTFIRRRALTEPDADLRRETVSVYCTRFTMADGGKAITPDPDAPERIQIRYFQPQAARATVPYTRTVLAQERVPA